MTSCCFAPLCLGHCGFLQGSLYKEAATGSSLKCRGRPQASVRPWGCSDSWSHLWISWLRRLGGIWAPLLSRTAWHGSDWLRATLPGYLRGAREGGGWQGGEAGPNASSPPCNFTLPSGGSTAIVCSVSQGIAGALCSLHGGGFILDISQGLMMPVHLSPLPRIMWTPCKLNRVQTLGP